MNNGWCQNADEAREAGRQAAREWEGPNGDGSMGSASMDFLAEQAKETGFPDAWWDGWEGKPSGRRD